MKILCHKLMTFRPSTTPPTATTRPPGDAYSTLVPNTNSNSSWNEKGAIAVLPISHFQKQLQVSMRHLY